ncbi:MAG: TlpA disulfide reductase family protein [Salinivirgaceae bacterium]
MGKPHYILIVAGILLATSLFGQKKKLEVGQMAPDIVLQNPNGEEVRLSDLRGKLVLVDFWASWCVPCRKEHPNLVKVYQKYKDDEFVNGKGFTIYSVSLDSRKPRWEEAIEKDQLEWPYHVSDMKGWRSVAAKKYGVSAIPANYLVNGDGEIIAIYMRGSEVQSTLDKFKEGWVKKVFK